STGIGLTAGRRRRAEPAALGNPFRLAPARTIGLSVPAAGGRAAQTGRTGAAHGRVCLPDRSVLSRDVPPARPRSGRLSRRRRPRAAAGARARSDSARSRIFLL